MIPREFSFSITIRATGNLVDNREFSEYNRDYIKRLAIDGVQSIEDNIGGHIDTSDVFVDLVCVKQICESP